MLAPKTKILIVEDMPTMQLVITGLMRELGFTEVSEAQDAVKAWQMIAEAQPCYGLVICDYSMPNLNGPNATGIDLMKRVHADSRFTNLPFIMMAVRGEQEKVSEIMKAGAKQVLLKPFNAKGLSETLKQIQGRS